MFLSLVQSTENERRNESCVVLHALHLTHGRACNLADYLAYFNTYFGTSVLPICVYA